MVRKGGFIMYIISKAKKGQEFLYSKDFMIECKSEKQAKELAKHLNENNETTTGIFKLKESETWHDYKIDIYDSAPVYKVKTTKNKISIIRL